MAIPTSLCALSLEDYLRSFYLLAAASILLASSIPQLSARFFCYGKTAQPTASPVEKKPADKARSTNIVTQLLDYLTTLTVPHAYFSHFYLLSLVSSLFWAAQFLLNGSLLRYLLSLGHGHPTAQEDSISPTQLLLAWLCLLLQSLRRYHEQLTASRIPSSSKMLLPHYLLGHAFYLATTLSIFASSRHLLLGGVPSLTTTAAAFPPPPLIKTALSLLLFLLSSSLQHTTHTYLLSLPKYSLPAPTHPLFTQVLSPHYLFEILIYLSLAVLSAPPGIPVNPTMFYAAVFVAANLGVSAGRTWAWYRDRFGEKAVGGKSCPQKLSCGMGAN
ncbi:putative 3-oxo-5-alpha-steroid 4-dehydrogenase [Tirmania nivea]|nr:putative 3-oxo-5-alpha-steroid 4-dehydrogenase [Tirmania nivea]